MFDLDQQIQSWRETAGGTLGSSAEILDELEAHLRDEFDRLTRAGQSPADAWNAAAASLGNARELAGEFAKLPNRFWLPAWVATISLALIIAIVAWFVVARLAAGGFRPLLAAHVVFVTAGYTAVLAIGFLGICAILTRAVSEWSDQQDAAFRAAGGRLAVFAVITTFIGVVLGAWWARDNLGRWWGWDAREIGGLCVLAWSSVLIQGIRSRQSPPPSRMCLAVMANMVVALSWFGPALLSGAHSYGQPSYPVGMLLGGFLVGQILFIYLTLLPAGALRSSRFRAAGRG